MGDASNAAGTTVGVTASVGTGVVVGWGVLGMAVGALPTGREVTAGTCDRTMSSRSRPAPASRTMFLFDIRKSVPELNESELRLKRLGCRQDFYQGG